MSVINFYKILVRGESKVLDVFVSFFNQKYERVFDWDGESPRLYSDLYGKYKNKNSYLIEINEYFQDISRVINLDEILYKFPSLRFDCLDELDGQECIYSLYLGGSLIEDFWGDYSIMAEREYGFLSQDFISRGYVEGYDKWEEINELKDIEWRIYEKDFPGSLPDKAPGYDLKVLNKQGEIEAYFYRIGFILKDRKFLSPEDFCSHYDQLFEDYVNWLFAGLNPNCTTPQEQIVDYRRVVNSLQWDPYSLSQIEWTEFPIIQMGAYRLASPYHCNIEKVKNSLLKLDSSIRSWVAISLIDIKGFDRNY